MPAAAASRAAEALAGCALKGDAHRQDLPSREEARAYRDVAVTAGERSNAAHGTSS
jgi:hypothetical protein